MNYNALAAIEEQAEMLREYGNFVRGKPSDIMDDYPLPMAQQIAWLSHTASTLYLDPKIQEMLSEAMGTLPDTVPLLETDVPMRAGFMKLGTPIRVDTGITNDGWNEVTHIGWNSNGVNTVLFPNATKPAHETLDVPSAIVHLFGRPHRGRLHTPPLQHLNAFPWGYGKALDNDDYYRAFEREYAGETIEVDTRNGYESIKHDVQPEQLVAAIYLQQITAFRWAFSLWHFMQQKVAAKERHYADRAMRKRLEAEPDTKWVDIITLRSSERTAQREFDETTRHVSVRFIVRGHWRNQWYPSENRHKPLWIMPYIKGPDNAPVQNPIKLFNLAR